MRAIALVSACSLIAVNAFVSYNVCSDASQESRPCTAFELNPEVCLCPGKGHRVYFDLEVLESSIPNVQGAPNKDRTLITFNGTAPGPEIVVTEGDWVHVKVHNRLPKHTNYSSIAVHWHGLDQVLTVTSDGVAGATQCAIMPGDSLVYTFRASMPGTFWYHGHKTEHYLDGLYGALVVKPLPSSPQYPAHANDWTVVVSDFYAFPARHIGDIYYMTNLSNGAEPIPDAIAVNGVVGTLGTVKGGHGLHFVAPPRGRTLIRFIAANAFSVFNISIDGCKLQVIELDGTLVESLPVAWFILNVGQRVAVIVDWTDVSNGPWGASGVYMRVWAMSRTYANSLSYVPPYEQEYPAMRRLIALFLATVQFKTIAQAGYVKPNYNPYTGVGAPPPPLLTAEQRAIQRDPNLVAARPVVKSAAPKPTHGLYLEIDIGSTPAGIPLASFNDVPGLHLMNTSAAADVFTLAGVYGSRVAKRLSSPRSYRILHSAPSGSIAERALAGLKPIMADSAGRYLIPAGAVVLVFSENTDGGEHPIHLHGHPFYLLETSSNLPGTQQKFAPYFLRRDVATVDAGGWAKYVFVADYATVIMVHCHIDWHMRAGLMSEFIIAPETMLGMPIADTDRKVCKEALVSPHYDAHRLR